ncbi:hypothetical protein VP1G_10735 [Cytospora mali]|uniref:Uncharacterized protein n=1 Tax=Cytospora mali TaxID=578113 RepID=A0A194UVM8_CYTMA|nr:hypothetical protein VP1G_10735 [Valsa mali var. pyri (nom. inval.)]
MAKSTSQAPSSKAHTETPHDALREDDDLISLNSPLNTANLGSFVEQALEQGSVADQRANLNAEQANRTAEQAIRTIEQANRTIEQAIHAMEQSSRNLQQTLQTMTVGLTGFFIIVLFLLLIIWRSYEEKMAATGHHGQW